MEQPPDHHFAVHHMAVAVEHLSKAYLCSIDVVLIACEKPDTDDLLILTGHEDRAKRQRQHVKTIGGEALFRRVGEILGESWVHSTGVRRLREVRNGIAHLGLGETPDEIRALLVAGITHLNDLLAKLGRPTAEFWDAHESLSMRLVQETVTERQLRYESKLRRAHEFFERRFSGVPEQERINAILRIASIPQLFGRALHGLAGRVGCPACRSPAMVRGNEYLQAYGTWFSPEYFHCAVCELTLEGDALDGGELELAGITGHYLSDHEDEQEYFYYLPDK